MRRSLLLSVCLCLLLVSGLVVTGANGLDPQASNGLAVGPNENPAQELDAPSWACYSACVLPSGIAAGDMDGDGWPDIAVSCAGTGQVLFYPNQGPAGTPGVFPQPGRTAAGSSPSAKSVVAGTNAAYVASRVFNGTSFQWVVHGVTTPIITALPPNPWQRGTPPAPTNSIVSIAGGDLDHNPTTADDLVVLQPDGTVLSLMGPSTVVGAYGPVGTTTGSATPIDAVVADFNQDGWNDIAVATAGNAVDIFFAEPFSPLPYAGPGAGTLTFRAPVPSSLPFTPAAIDAGDFNADGLIDFVVVGENGDQFAAVYLNSPLTPGAKFDITADGPMKTWGFEVVDVVVADFDGNGRDDFAVANRSSDTVTMFLSDAKEPLGPDERNTSERCLNPSQLLLDRLDVSFGLYKLTLDCGYFPVALAAADFDWNGKVDLAVALESAKPEICPQNKSCIEVIFDPACGLHKSGNGDVPNQVAHQKIDGVAASESQICEPCKEAPCDENKPPNATIETEEDGSGN